MGLRRMNWFIPVLTVLGILGTRDAALAEEQGPWRTDFAEALAEAERLGRPLLLHFSAEWCAPCRRMEQEVLDTPAVRKQIDGSFVAVRVDSDAHPELVERFEVKALPSDIFMAADGQILARQEGYQNRETYVARMARIDAQFTRMQDVKIASDPPPVRRKISKPSPQRERTFSMIPGGGHSAPQDHQSSAPQRNRSSTPDGSHDNPGPPPSIRPRLPRSSRNAPLQIRPRRDASAPAEPNVAPPEFPGQDTPSAEPQPPSWPRRSAVERSSPRQRRPAPHLSENKRSLRQSFPRPGSRDDSSPRGDRFPGNQAERSPQPKMRLRVALEGYSPVSLWRHRKWRKGSEEFTAVYKGAAYLMTSADEMKAFLENPAQYVPRLQGADPVIMWETDRAVSGSVRFAAYFEDKLYLFANTKTRQRFKQNPQRYTRTRHVLKDRPGTSRN